MLNVELSGNITHFTFNIGHSLPVPDVDEMPFDGCGDRHRRRNEMRAAPSALPAFEIPIAR
jgi:hypothetical protein